MLEMNCRNCGKEVEEGWSICPYCMQPVNKEAEQKCSKCGVTLEPNALFCHGCGTKIKYEQNEKSVKKSVCNNCGYEIQTGAKFCRKCGMRIGESSINNTTVKWNESVLKNENMKKSSQDKIFYEDNLFDFSIKNTIITGRLIAGIVSAIAIACFFCKVYKLSFLGIDVISLNGWEAAFGMDYSGGTLHGDWLFVIILLLLFMLGAMSWDATTEIKKKNLQELYDLFSEMGYAATVGGITILLYIWYYTSLLRMNYENGVVVDQCVALHIIKVLTLVLIGIGLYWIYQTEKYKCKEEEVQESHIWLKILGRILKNTAIAFLGILIFYTLANEYAIPFIKTHL